MNGKFSHYYNIYSLGRVLVSIIAVPHIILSQRSIMEALGLVPDINNGWCENPLRLLIGDRRVESFIETRAISHHKKNKKAQECFSLYWPRKQMTNIAILVGLVVVQGTLLEDDIVWFPWWSLADGITLEQPHDGWIIPCTLGQTFNKNWIFRNYLPQ